MGYDDDDEPTAYVRPGGDEAACGPGAELELIDIVRWYKELGPGSNVARAAALQRQARLEGRRREDININPTCNTTSGHKKVEDQNKSPTF